MVDWDNSNFTGDEYPTVHVLIHNDINATQDVLIKPFLKMQVSIGNNDVTYWDLHFQELILNMAASHSGLDFSCAMN